jgi:hypothetical protein
VYDRSARWHSLCTYAGVTVNTLRLNGKDTVMLHSRSVQNYVCASEDRDLMLFSALLLACVLLLEENYQQLRQC